MNKLYLNILVVIGLFISLNTIALSADNQLFGGSKDNDDEF